MSSPEKNLFNNLPTNLPKEREKPTESRASDEKYLSKNLFMPDPISAEMAHLRTQLANVMNEIRTMKWGKK